MAHCRYGCKAAEDDFGKCPLLIAAYILAGLSMMLNIRLSYSSAPYALIRFKLPENLFSVFVRRMASSLELWCLPGFIIADAIELAVKLAITSDFSNWNNLDSKKLKFGAIIIPSIIAQWLNFLTYVILLIVYLAGGDHGRLTTFYWTIAVSGFVFGINNPLVFAANYHYIPIYIAGENCFPALTSFIHYLATLMFGNRRKYDSDFILVFIDIWVAIIISFVAAVVWTLAYGICTDAAPDCTITKVTSQTQVTITYQGDEKAKVEKAGYVDPPGTNGTYKYTVKNTETKNITYTFTLRTQLGAAGANGAVTIEYGHIFAEGFSGTGAKESLISPLLIVLVGMGLVYAIYPGIAPGMIVPFYLVDKIEMVLLIATIFPPVIIALLQRFAANWSPKTNYVWHGNDKTGLQGWLPYASTHVKDTGRSTEQKEVCNPVQEAQHLVHAYLWHFFDIVVPTMIILAYLFIYSLHYRDSKISRSIVNQPKMSTALTIIFYMCHEIALAVGFAGMVGNGAEYTVIAQMVGAFLMVFLALYSEGYLIEYKSHDPTHWPTEGMTKWNAFCYWCKRASKITNHNLRSLFRT
ncbi:Tpr-related protein family member, putative [Theileria annulata]|uniref:Tpr-related protein family member, putative n=1 Tax=Theileria annulata TaxID=5874 RepID=Q4U967_THEAN|nr:Tpr-related protein family member, putative [Theileria annulata]CAI76636.1 Tpr-related protein family member, putative [Theileria annulata]|eukprot:XP_953261.1 Tpr-related protein family member, putative [Theileria annulata]